MLKYAVMALAMLAGVSQAQAGAEGKRVALLMGPTQDKYLGAITKNFTDEAAKKGMKVTVFSSPFDPALQSQQIDDAIAQKFDILVVQILSQKAIVAPLTRAKAAHIPVVLVVAPFMTNEHDDLYKAYAGSDHTLIGGMAADAIVQGLKKSGRDKGNIVILAGAMAEGNAPIREAAFRKEMAKYPSYKIIALEDVKWSPVVAEKATGQLLARFSGQGGIDAIYAMSDTIANGAVQAATAAGVKVGTGKGDLLIVGGSCQTPGIRNIEAGKMYATMLVAPSIEGKLGADAAADVLDGKPVKKLQSGPHAIVDPTNVKKYEDLCVF